MLASILPSKNNLIVLETRDTSISYQVCPDTVVVPDNVDIVVPSVEKLKMTLLNLLTDKSQDFSAVELVIIVCVLFTGETVQETFMLNSSPSNLPTLLSVV